MMAAYDDYEALDGILDSLATPELPEIVACRIEYEPILAENCYFDLTFVIQREATGLGREVYVRSGMGDDASATCLAFGDCIRDTWGDRSVPFPLNQDSEYFSTMSGVAHHQPMVAQRDHRQIYQAVISQQAEQVAFLNGELEATLEPMATWSHRHNLHLAEAQIIDAELMLAQLE